MRALWVKAQIAARSARLLLEAGDTDGAVNRAYYVMFSAARAALAVVRRNLSRAKRHGTIFRRFDKHLVGERSFDRLLGRSFLGKHRKIRQAADYNDELVDERFARSLVEDMGRFLAAIGVFLAKSKARSTNVCSSQFVKEVVS